jgi:hypothetical protein
VIQNLKIPGGAGLIALVLGVVLLKMLKVR